MPLKLEGRTRENSEGTGDVLFFYWGIITWVCSFCTISTYKICWWLWWLILYVNFTEQRDPQIAGKTLFIGMSVRVFPEEISIWLSRLKKGDLTKGKWALSNQLIWIEQKAEERSNCSLLDMKHLSSSAFRHQDF